MNDNLDKKLESNIAIRGNISIRISLYKNGKHDSSALSSCTFIFINLAYTAKCVHTICVILHFLSPLQAHSLYNNLLFQFSFVPLFPSIIFTGNCYCFLLFLFFFFLLLAKLTFPLPFRFCTTFRLFTIALTEILQLHQTRTTRV